MQKREGFPEKFGGYFFKKVAAKFLWEATTLG